MGVSSGEQRSPEHDWRFTAGNRFDDDRAVLLVIGICRNCGLVRRRTAGQNVRLDLSGECPGR